MPTPCPEQLVAVLGRGVLALDEPLAHADDLGLTRGDGCFEATLVVADGNGHRVLHLERHLARLARSAAALQLPPPDPAAWRGLVAEATAAWARTAAGDARGPGGPATMPAAAGDDAYRPGAGEGVLKLVLTRGREHHCDGTLGYLTVTPLGEAALARRAGLRVVTLSRGHASDAYADAPWLLGGVKTISYAVNMAVQRTAQERGADEVLFTSTDGFALEGPTAGLVVRTGDTLASTPVGATGILDSITVATLFEAAQAEGRATERRLLTPAQVRTCDGAWLVSSGRGVAPIRTLDGASVAADPLFSRHLNVLAGFPA